MGFLQSFSSAGAIPSSQAEDEDNDDEDDQPSSAPRLSLTRNLDAKTRWDLLEAAEQALAQGKGLLLLALFPFQY
jgi:hypothetical protein